MPLVLQNLGAGSEQCSCEIRSATRAHRQSTAGLATNKHKEWSFFLYIYLDFIVVVAVAPVAVTTSLTPKDQERRRKKKLLQS